MDTQAARMPAGLRTVTATSAPDRAPLLDEIDNSVAIASKDLSEIVGQTRDRADSVFGSQPETVGNISKPPSGTGRATDIREKLSWLHETISSLRAQLARFNAL